MVRITALSAAGLAIAGLVSAHPGEKHDHNKMKRDIALRDGVANIGQRSLASCSNSAGAQKRQARAVERRAQKVKEIRAKKGLTSRQPPRLLSDFLNLKANITESLQEVPPRPRPAQRLGGHQSQHDRPVHQRHLLLHRRRLQRQHLLRPLS